MHGTSYSYVDGTTETKLNADGSSTSEWVKTITDGLGRQIATVYADNSTNQSIYNSQGQLASTVDPDGVTTTYSYNAKGELALTTITNRITQTTNDVIYDLGFPIWFHAHERRGWFS